MQVIPQSGRSRQLLTSLIALICLAALSIAFAQETRPLQPLKYRSIGPAAGGRICRVAGVPGDPLIYYAATASSGLWKSNDGGLSWKPLMDDRPVSSIGSLAVAASDPNVIYAGAGEANIRGNVVTGNGIYKSIDAGKTWSHVWKQVGQIGTMLVHPTNPDRAFAAVLGHAHGPNNDRGVYSTQDGGKTWQQVLARDADTGASDVCFDPTNPNILFAGLWQARRRPWELTSGGPGSGLYTSRDGGDTWKQLSGKGLPDGPWGKVGVAVAPSDGRRVYSLIEAENGGLFRSDDAGDTWKLASAHRALRQRAWYYTTITIDPKNPDVLWCPQVAMMKSIDGGRTFKSVKGFHHGDHHDLWIDPQNPKRLIDGNDGGVDLSTNGGETWFAPQLPISQFYHINVDNRLPYHVSGTMQDIGCMAGPSNSLSRGGIGLGEWYGVGGGETGYTAHDPTDPTIVYAGEYGGAITRFDFRTRQARNIGIYPENPSGHGAEAMRWRFRWPAPILLSPHDPKVLYHAGNVLFKTTDGGLHWTAISPDLTRNDKARQRWSGGPITGDNTTAEFYCTISAVAESPKQRDLLWVGTDDGLVQISRDGGKTWTNVMANIPDLPEWGTISSIEPSRFDPGTAYVVVDAHLLDDRRPYLYVTTDYGQSWKSLASGLPQEVYLHVVREDPKRKSILFLGTERGVSYSIDQGETWLPLQLNLPTVPVHDLVVKDDDLVVGTHGRSIWILDDLTPLREASPAVAESDLHLFPVLPTIRWRYHSAVGRQAAGDNPPAGAVIHYSLKKKPKTDLTLDIVDAQGAVVANLSSKEEPEPESDGDYEQDRPKKAVLTKEPGVNRAVWDLAHTGADKISGAKVDSGDPSLGPLAAPGIYTVRLSHEGKVLSTPLVVRMDPRVTIPEGEQREQLQFALTLRNDISRLTQTVNQLRAIRRQLAAQGELLKDDTKAASLCKLCQELVGRFDALEARLHNPKAQVAYDILAQRGGAKLYSRMTLLFEFAKDGDGAPTQGMKEVYAEQARELKECEADFRKLLAGELAALNQLAKQLDIAHVIVPPAKKK